MKSFFALLATLLLFTTVAAYAGDAKNITIDEAEKVIKANTNVVVLDIRTPKEFQAGHIKGATNINFMDKDFAKKMESLDKSKTYVIHCQGGGRSGRTCEQIKTMDFKNMLHMNQGYGAWEKAGKPVEK